MDIQEMVDARIEELRNQAMRTASCLQVADSGINAGTDFREELTGLSELMDNVLNEIATRVLEITESVSRDYTRLEKDLLNSRLAVLQGAENIMDMALSLKRQAREAIEEALDSPERVVETQPGKASGEWRREAGSPSHIARRASMRNNGVADLFKRTQN